MCNEQFANEFIARLDGKLSSGDLQMVLDTMRQFSGDYEINRRETGIVPAGADIMPPCYRAFLVTKKLEGRSAGTMDNYRRQLTDFLFNIGKPVTDITADDIRVYLYKYQAKHQVGNRYLDVKRLVINSFMSWCAEEGYIRKNACAQVRPIKYEAKPREPLNDIEIEMVRRACETERELALFETIYSSGCRVSELCGLKKDDVDLQSRTVYLFGKGQKHRISYLSAKAVISLGKYLDGRTDTNPSLFVSLRAPHENLKKSAVESIFRKIGKQSGIGRPLFPHLVRHTMATDALSHGMDITDIQQILGHEKLDTTMIYAKIPQERIRQSHRKYVH